MYRSIIRRGQQILSPAGAILNAAFLSFLIVACGGHENRSSGQWVASWFAAQQNYNEGVVGTATLPPNLTIANQTIRQIIHTSTGGKEARVKMSNLYNAVPVTFSAIRLARSTGNGAIDLSSDKPVTFSGAATLTLAPGAEAWSDNVSITFANQEDLAISLYIQGSAQVASEHATALQTNYLVSGNQSSAPTLSGITTTTAYYWISGIDVNATDKIKVLVAFGDSISDGYHSEVSANHRWPNFFDDRAQSASASVGKVSVVNSGISGNRWLHDKIGPNALSRFGRDVLSISGATHVIILLGINDIGIGSLYSPEVVTADQIIDAITNAVAQAKAKGLKVFLATLTPYQGSFYYDTVGEMKREAINSYVRSAPGPDGVIDFDKAVRDPSNPTMILPVYDSGDHLHPNDAGYQAMANAINLDILR